MRRTVISAVLGGALAASLALVPSVASAAGDPPPNDNFNNGQVILSAGQSVAEDNIDAGKEEGEPNHAGATWEGEPLGPTHSIWWSWTATDSGEAKIITCNSDFDTRLAVYTGDAVGSLTPVASALDTNGGECNNLWAGVTFTATAGTTYRIAVDTEGDLSGQGQGPPWGMVNLTLTAPPSSEPPPPAEDTNPGTAADEAPYTFTMLRLKPLCAEEGSKSVNECPRDATNLRFYSAEELQTWPNRQDSVVRWVEKLRRGGADINLVMVPKPSSAMDGAVMKYLRKQGRGGEILTQNVTPRQKVTTTSEKPLLLKVSYFDPAEDQKILDATLAALTKAGEDRKEVKSPCDFINSNASPDMIETKLAQSLGSGTMTQKRAGQILKEYGCHYEVTYPDGPECDRFLPQPCPAYVDGAGLTTDTVLDVLGSSNRKLSDGTRLGVIHLKVALPVAQDFAFVISEEPEFADVNMLGLGLDGKLTASATQPNRITVQVVERATGRLVPGCYQATTKCVGVTLDFYDHQGKPVSQQINDKGEWTFTSLMPTPGRYALKASYKGTNGVSMLGFRSIDVVDRRQSYTTMSGRTITWDSQTGRYTGDAREIYLHTAASKGDPDSKYLPIVKGILGSGIAGAPTEPPAVQQIDAAVPSGSTFVVGQHNAVYLPDNANYLVGSASGLVTIAGDSTQTTSRPVSARSWAAAQQVANWLLRTLSGLQAAVQTGVGTVIEKTSASDKEAIAESVRTLIKHGAQGGGDQVSQGVVGLIGQAGGNLIGQAGGNVTDISGLTLISDKGLGFTAKIISTDGSSRWTHGRAGLGLYIGAKNVISLEKNMMPVYGGNDIAVP